MMEQWHWWTLAFLMLLIGEAFVPGLVLGSLAVGAFAGGLASMFTDWWEYQFVAASAGAVLSAPAAFSATPGTVEQALAAGHRAIAAARLLTVPSLPPSMMTMATA